MNSERKTEFSLHMVRCSREPEVVTATFSDHVESMKPHEFANGSNSRTKNAKGVQATQESQFVSEKKKYEISELIEMKTLDNLVFVGYTNDISGTVERNFRAHNTGRIVSWGRFAGTDKAFWAIDHRGFREVIYVDNGAEEC